MQNRSFQAIVRAAASLDGITWLATFCVLAGWFFMSTLHVSAGPFNHDVAFYDLAAIIGQPVRVFAGVDHAHSPGTWLFAIVCLCALLAPLLPFLWEDRAAWLSCLAPALLIAACGVLMYARTSGEFVATTNNPDAISNDVIRFANGLIHRGGDIAARSVSIAAGAYLALLGSAYLAWRGLREYRKSVQASQSAAADIRGSRLP